MAWTVSDAYRTALGGSYDVSCRASVSLEGRTLCESLPIAPGASLTSEWAGQSVRDRLTLPLVDDTAELLAMDLESPLAPFGQRVQVTAEVSVSGKLVDAIPMGTFRIDDPGSEGETWTTYQRGAQVIWVPTARTYTVQAGDLLDLVAEHPIVTDMTATGTLSGDSARLLDGLIPLGWTSSTASPSGTVWTDDRLSALSQLAERASMVPAVGRDACYRPRSTKIASQPDWTLTAGSTLISYGIKVSSAGLYNAVVVTGEDATQKPTRGAAYVGAGPLRWGGPMGKRELEVNNPAARSNALATSIAQGQLDGLLAKLAVPVVARCRPNPAIDVMDTMQLTLPRGVTYTGLVTRLVTPLHPGEDQEVEVAVPWNQVWNA